MARRGNEYDKVSIGGRSKLRRRLLIVLVAGLVLAAALPTLVLNRTVLVPVVNRFAGIAPLKIDLESVSGGWMQALAMQDVKVTGADGQPLVSIDEVVTQKTVSGWALDSSNLGVITIRGMEAIVVCADGTSDLETALGPLLAPVEAEPVDPSVPTAPMAGRIEVIDSKLMLAERDRAEQWIVEIANASMTLPEAGQWLGPTELKARIGDASGVSGVAPGTIDLNVKPNGTGLALDGNMQTVPLNFWHVVKARIPSLPADELAGAFSASLSGQYTQAEDWNVDIQQASLSNVRIDAPTLVGEKPATLQAVNIQGGATLSGGMLNVNAVQLQSDFANMAISAGLPWPLQFPTMASPLIRGGVIDARGTIDLPRLVKAAETLLPVREGLDLQSGTAQFVIKQDLPSGQASAAIARIELSDLTATLDGKQIAAKAPVTLACALNDGPAPNGSGSLQSEFANLQAEGGLERGTLQGNLDLQKLFAEASNWVELPFTQMAGTVATNLSWAVDDSSLLKAKIDLRTSELLLASASGQIREAAWTGAGNAEAKIENGTATWLNQAALDLHTASEKLALEITQPISLTATAEEPSNVAPAAFTASLVGDLAAWQRRSSLLLTEPLPAQIAGNMRLAAQGRLDMLHAEITAANWNAEPLQVTTESIGFADSRLMGHFKGMVDTNDLMQLRVDDLTVQSTAISLVASDAVASNGKDRVGKAVFRLDLARLMNNVQTPAAAPTIGAQSSEPATGSITATGLVDGNLNWTMGEAITLNADAVVQQLQVFSVTAENPQGELLWTEPSVSVGIRGEHASETGEIIVDQLALRTEWLTYGGRFAYDPGQTEEVALPSQASTIIPASFVDQPAMAAADRPASMNLAGQIDYDCGLLSNKLAPLTGGQFTMAGRRQVPLKVNLVFPFDPTAPTLSGLDATTQLAWTEANAVGIVIGESVVPVEIRGGKLASKAEMPVSGGALRWDMRTDLAADVMAIDLAPMKVIENVELTEAMCKGWLKYIAPMVAEAASVDGRLTLELNEAHLVPAEPAKQTVNGVLQIFDARVGPGPLSSGVLAVVSQVEALRRGELGQGGSYQRSWLDLPQQRIKFRMIDGQVHHENLNVRVGDVAISTSGSVGVDGQMNLVAQMPIPDDWADKSPLLQGLRGQSLQFPMQGSLSQPQINTDFLRQFGRTAVRGAAQGLLQQGLTKGLGRLFGPPPEADKQP